MGLKEKFMSVRKVGSGLLILLLAGAGPLPLHSQEILIDSSVRGELLGDFSSYLKEKGLEAKALELLSEERKVSNSRPRFEERKVEEDTLQLALIFPSTEMRDDFFAKASYQSFKVVKAGSTTVEVGVKGVDKALAINYLSNHFEEIFEGEKNKGLLFDPFKSRTLFISDADGTIYAKPQADKDHNLFSLDSSPAGGPLKSYLAKGGLAAIISGNDIYRVIERINRGFSEDEQELKGRLILFANGGATLFTFRENQWKEHRSYRQQALGEGRQGELESDFIYVGDDHQEKGNDYPAFLKVGRDRAVCVSDRPTDAALSIPGFEAGTAKLLEWIGKRMKSCKEGPLFHHLPAEFSY